MAWYTILFITVMAVFIIKLAVSWFAGDFDLDIDLDGDADFDTSSAFSFKGLLHFFVGFSSYLFARSYTSTVNIVNGQVQFSIADYVWAIIVGIAVMFALYFAYKIALKANCESKNPQELINGSKGKIYLNLGNGQYSVQANTLAGTTNVTAFYSGDDLEVGTEVKLVTEGNQIFIESNVK